MTLEQRLTKEAQDGLHHMHRPQGAMLCEECIGVATMVKTTLLAVRKEIEGNPDLMEPRWKDIYDRLSNEDVEHGAGVAMLEMGYEAAVKDLLAILPNEKEA